MIFGSESAGAITDRSRIPSDQIQCGSVAGKAFLNFRPMNLHRPYAREDAPVKAAFYNQLNVQLEFLQPVGDTDKSTAIYSLPCKMPIPPAYTTDSTGAEQHEHVSALPRRTFLPFS